MTSHELKRLFGLRVQALRRRRNLTQEELAEAIGRSVDTVSNIERGFSSTRIETAQIIADAVGVSLAELFELDEPTGKNDRELRKAIERVIRQVGHLPPNSVEAISHIIECVLQVSKNLAKSEK